MAVVELRHDWGNINAHDPPRCKRCGVERLGPGSHGGCIVDAYHPDAKAHDPVNHPSHYCSHPSGVECIDIVEHFDFCIGNAIKYAWRAGLKGDALEDLKKAQWYINRAIAQLEKAKKP